MANVLDQSEFRNRVFREIETGFPQEVDLLQNLIRIPTVNPPGKYEDIANFLESFARRNEIHYESYETPRDVCEAANVESDDRRISVKTVIGTRGAKPRILLLAHLDTVPVGEASNWVHEPFGGEIVNNKMFGRGACDCKGRLAAYFSAQLAIKKVVGELPCEISVAATVDEEIGGRTGAKYLLDSGKLDCDFCIGEGYSWEIFNGFKGLLWIRISITGHSAHGGTPHLGASAALPLDDLLRELKNFQEKLLQSESDTTMNIGLVRSGTKINMVPDSATIEIDFRVGESYGVQRVLDEVSSIVDRIQKMYGKLAFKVEVTNRSEPISLYPNHLLVNIVRSAVEEVAQTTIPVKLWFAHSDTIHFLKAGIASVNYGVGRAGIPHTADEHVDLDDLKMSTKAIALTLIKLVGLAWVAAGKDNPVLTHD